MEKILAIANALLGLSTEKQIFIIAMLSMAVTGFALYVVLVALKKGSENRGKR